MKPLPAAPRRVVFMVHRFDQPVAIAQSAGQQGSVVARDWQSAARGRTVERERADDGMATGSQGAIHDPQIGLLICSAGQKMKCRPIMPDIEAPGRHPGQHVTHHPLHWRILWQPRAGIRQSGV